MPIYNLPSSNHKPIDFKKEAAACKKACKLWLKEGNVAAKDIKRLFDEIDRDPFEWGKRDSEIVGRNCIYGSLERSRFVGHLNTYVSCQRKLYFKNI